MLDKYTLKSFGRQIGNVFGLFTHLMLSAPSVYSTLTDANWQNAKPENPFRFLEKKPFEIETVEQRRGIQTKMGRNASQRNSESQRGNKQCVDTRLAN